jgi:hypothetical protein
VREWFAARLVEFERRLEDAVDIAEQAAFLATAKLGEFTDASVPRTRTFQRAPGDAAS